MSIASTRVVSYGHPLFLAGLSWLLRSTEDIEQVAVVERGAELLAALDRHRPDVAVIDLDLPADAGLSGVRLLRGRTPAVPVLAVAATEVVAYPAMVAGARGFVTKVAEPAEVRLAIQALATGMVVLGPGASGVLDRLNRTTATTPFSALTSREHEVLDLMAGGMNNGGIARHLRISDKTVRNHVSNILAKLGAADRTGAIVLARDAGLGSPAYPVGRRVGWRPGERVEVTGPQGQPGQQRGDHREHHETACGKQLRRRV
jgi:DNA-binding NarL/FixJ family response regulator